MGVSLPQFSVVDNSFTSRTAKTQYTERLVLEAPADSAALRALLQSRLGYGRRFSSEWHEAPTVLASYVFAPDGDPTGAGWLAMVSVTPVRPVPEFTFNGEAIAHALAPPSERSGLTLEERRGLFRDLVAAEQRARCEADATVGFEDAKSWSRTWDRLKARYEAELIRERGLTQAVADSVSLEGLMARWPMPEAPCD